MKNKWQLVVIIMMIITGLSLLLYPSVSNFINNLEYSRVIADFKSRVEVLTPEEKEDLLADARAYNEELTRRGGLPVVLDDDLRPIYEKLLDFTGTGVIGYIEIPKVNIYLPIYHGTSEAVLQSGVGHLQGTSMPVGGKGTHCTLSSHRGLPSARLFTDVDQLEEGDTFTLHVIDQELTYEVDQILVVLPYDLNALDVVEGEDYCTLVTCTPYSVNTHRLLVRGHRVETVHGEDSDNKNGTDVSAPFDIMHIIVGVLSIVVTMLATTLMIIVWRRRKR